MKNNHAFHPLRFFLVHLFVLCLFVTGCLVSSPINAKPITVTALAQNAKPLYANHQVLPYANANAPKGGEISMAVTGSFDSFNNFIDKGNPASGLYYVYESLMQNSLDEAFTMYPLLAEKVTHDPDDASWVMYHINPKARFQDGSAVTADDVVFTFEKLLSEGAMFYRNYLSAIKHVKAIDKHSVKFTFNNKKNQEMKLIVGQISIISKDFFTKNRFDQASLQKPMGSGAYKVKDFQSGRYIKYERDPNHWGKNILINKGANNFDTMTYRYYRSHEVAFEGFKAGQYNYRREYKSRNWAVNYNFPAIKQGRIIQEEISDDSPIYMQAFVLNNRRPLFKDIRVRKALKLAYDFKWMNKTLFYGLYEGLYSNFQGSELEAKGYPSLQEQQVLKPLLKYLPKQQQIDVLKPLAQVSSNGDGFNRNNLIKARQLLLQAGFTYQKHHKKIRLFQPNGEPAKIELLNQNANLNRIILPYVRHLKRLGFEVEIRMVDIPQYTERKRAFDFDVIMGHFPQGLSPGQEQMDYWTSKSAQQVGSRNTAGVSNKAVDTVVDKLIHAQSRNEVILYAKVLDRLLISGCYFVPTYGNSKKFIAYQKELGHPKRLPKYDVGLRYWWYEK